MSVRLSSWQQRQFQTTAENVFTSSPLLERYCFHRRLSVCFLLVTKILIWGTDYGPEKTWLHSRSDPEYILDIVDIAILQVGQQYITTRDATKLQWRRCFHFCLLTVTHLYCIKDALPISAWRGGGLNSAEYCLVFTSAFSAAWLQVLLLLFEKILTVVLFVKNALIKVSLTLTVQTRSTGTVHTSAKARLISVAIRIRIRIWIQSFVRWPIANLPWNFHANPFRSFCAKLLTDRQRNNDD